MTLDYEAVKGVVLYKIVAEEKEVDQEIMNLRKQAGQFTFVDEVGEEDMLFVNVTPEGGGEDFASTLSLNYINENDLPLFLGKKPQDEMDIDTVKIFKSEEERASFLKVKTEQLENASQMVHIKINSIYHKNLVEINEDFFGRVFPDGTVKDEAAMREKIKQEIELRHVHPVNVLYNKQVSDILAEKAAIELPDDFIKRHLIINKAASAELIAEKYDEMRKSVVQQLITEQIAKDCAIHVDQEEVVNYIDNFLRMRHFGTTATLDEETEKYIASSVEQMMKNEENVKTASENIFFDKITEGLKVKTKPKKKEVSYDAFLAEIDDKKEKPAKKATPRKTMKKTATETEVETKTEEK
jgi:trigger factor